jgi:hypothetical protein
VVISYTGVKEISVKRNGGDADTRFHVFIFLIGKSPVLRETDIDLIGKKPEMGCIRFGGSS